MPRRCSARRRASRGWSGRAHAGYATALVGANGAGKTTLVKLVTRLYDPTEGQVLVDGVDLRELDLEEWRRRTGAIFQDCPRYHLPARENVGLGRVECVDDRAAARYR